MCHFMFTTYLTTVVEKVRLSTHREDYRSSASPSFLSPYQTKHIVLWRRFSRLDLVSWTDGWD